MHNNEIWEVLGIEKTKDEKAIKTAYRSKLVSVNPEDDPEGFKRLREAYDTALNYSKSEEEELDEYDIWINHITEVYNDFDRRLDETEWNRIFDNELCISLDTQDMACERLLLFFINNYYVPDFVWKKVEKTFKVVENKNAWSEKFPSNYLDFIVNEMLAESQDRYFTYFSGDINENPDLLIRSISECMDEMVNQLVITEIEKRDFGVLKEKLAEINQMKASHVYSRIIEEIIAFYEKDHEKTKQYFSDVREVVGEDIGDILDDKSSAVILEAYALGYEVTGEKEKAEKIRQVLEQMNCNLFIISDNLRYYLDAGEYKKTKDLCIDYMEKYADYPVFMEYMVQSNEMLISMYKEKADAGDIDSAFELGWIYFQNEKFDECIQYIESKKPQQGEKNEYSYHNLMGRCCYRAKQYDKAIESLLRAAELIDEVREKGSEGEDEDKMIKRHGLILATTGMAYHDKAVKLLENSDVGKEEYKTADEYLDKAIEYAEKSLEVEQDLRDKIYFQNEAAIIYLDREEYTKCIDICDETLNVVSEWYAPYMLRQHAFYMLDYPQNVIDDYYTITRIMTNNLDNPHIYIYPLMSYIDYGREDNARELLKQAKENGVKSPTVEFLELYFEYGLNSDSHDIKEIDKCLERIVVEEGENDFTKKQIAEFYFYAAFLNDNEEYVIGKVSRGIEIYPGHKLRGYRILTSYYERRGEYKKAIEYYEKLLALSYTEESIHSYNLSMGRDYWYMDEDDKAFELFINVYKKNPKQFRVNRYLAEYYLFKFRNDKKSEDIDLALKYINEQIEVYSDNEILTIRAEIYLERFEIAECKKDVLTILENNPDYFPAKKLLERVYRHEGDFEKSYELCKEILERESDDKYTAKYTKYVYNCFALEKYDEIEPCIKEGYKHNREWALEYLIKLYIRTDRTDELMELANSAIIEGQTSYEKFLGYRTVLDALSQSNQIDKIEEAEEEYLKFIEENPERKVYGLDCLRTFFDEDYGNMEKAILYAKKMFELELSDYYKIKCSLSLATYYAFAGDNTHSEMYFNQFNQYIKEQYTDINTWVKEDGYSRIRIYNLLVYFYAAKDVENLSRYLEKMNECVICKSCDRWKCFEYYIAKGFLEELKGNIEEARKAYEIALENGGASNRKYITRFIDGLKKDE